MSQADDIKAINVYITGAKPRNPQATALQASWTRWHSALTFFERTLTGATLTEATKRRKDFNDAQGTPEVSHGSVLTPEEKNYFVNQMPRVNVTGLSKEAAAKKVWTVQPNAPTPPASLKHIMSATKPTTKRGTIKKGSKGDDVKAWQMILGVTADGAFGSGTDAATRKWQKENGLTADGVVGQASWAKARPIEPTDTDTAVASAETPGIFSAVASLLGSAPSQPVAKSPVFTSVPKVAAKAKPKTAPAKAPAANVFAATAAAMNKPNTGLPANSTPVGTTSTAAAGMPKVMQAGIFGNLEGLPLWAKVTGGIGILAAVIVGRKHLQNQAEYEQQQYEQY